MKHKKNNSSTIIFKKNILFKFLLFFILLITYIFLCAFSYSNKINNSLSNSFFRLHIIANSDSIEDQNLKLQIRDNILSFLNSSIESSNKYKTKSFLLNNSTKIQEIATKTIKENGYNYPVSIKFRNF